MCVLVSSWGHVLACAGTHAWDRGWHLDVSPIASPAYDFDFDIFVLSLNLGLTVSARLVNRKLPGSTCFRVCALG